MKWRKKMLKNKSLVLFFFLTLLTLLLLIVSTLAWIIARPTEIENIVLETGNLEFEVVLEYSYNGGSFVEVTNDLSFVNIIPGDCFDFKFSIYNKSTVRGRLTAQVSDITRSVIEPDIDMASQLILYSVDLPNVNNQSIKDLFFGKEINYFTLIDEYLDPNVEPIIYNFSICFNETAGNEYQNKFLRVGRIIVRLDQA